jgi:type II secretory pathway pseudopilin PulG
MKERNNISVQKTLRQRGERGISIVEMLIVVTMIGVVSAFAVMQIAGAQRAMRLSNSAREFTSWLDKTRLDSIRRHAVGGERANVTISSANTYTVTIDQDGDGTLDLPRTISFPATHGAVFAGITFPTVIYYDWRGRAVDNGGTLLNLSFRLQDSANNTNPIILRGTGDTSLDGNINTSNVSVIQLGNTANVKGKANVSQ